MMVAAGVVALAADIEVALVEVEQNIAVLQDSGMEAQL